MHSWTDPSPATEREVISFREVCDSGIIAGLERVVKISTWIKFLRVLPSLGVVVNGVLKKREDSAFGNKHVFVDDIFVRSPGRTDIRDRAEAEDFFDD